LIPIYIFKKFIPTRCPICKSRYVVCNLGSPRNDSRITYHCKSCGYSQKTPFSLGAS
jgi:transposase-like protein